MPGKDFNKGMAAGAKPFEEKFRLQSEAIERVGENLNSRLDEFDNINDMIIDDLTSIERKRLYDLNTVIDIASLDNAEKELLLAIIYTVSNMSDNTTEFQKHFVRSIKNYLDIKSPQIEVDLSSIENIENINSQKAILQTLMEFLFLEEANHEYIEKYEDIISYFSVNNRGILEIKTKIDNIYNATGLQGISENYGYIPEINEDIEEKVIVEKGYSFKNEIGNTLFNLKSGGLIANQEEWIYYHNFDDKNTLYKSKFNGEEKTKLVDDKAYNINVSGDWIYYEIKGSGIYKIRTNGTDRERIVELSEDDEIDTMFVIRESIYIHFTTKKHGQEGGIYRSTLLGKGMGLIFESWDILKFDETSIDFIGGSGYPRTIYKYDIDSETVLEISKIDSSFNSGIIYLNDKIYYQTTRYKRVLFMDLSYHSLRKKDIKTDEVQNITDEMSDDELGGNYNYRLHNIYDGYAYYCRPSKIEKYQPETPWNRTDVYNIEPHKTGKSGESIELGNLHIIKDRLYFVEGESWKTAFENVL